MNQFRASLRTPPANTAAHTNQPVPGARRPIAANTPRSRNAPPPHDPTSAPTPTNTPTNASSSPSSQGIMGRRRTTAMRPEDAVTSKREIEATSVRTFSSTTSSSKSTASALARKPTPVRPITEPGGIRVIRTTTPSPVPLPKTPDPKTIVATPRASRLPLRATPSRTSTVSRTSTGTIDSPSRTVKVMTVKPMVMKAKMSNAPPGSPTPPPASPIAPRQQASIMRPKIRVTATSSASTQSTRGVMRETSNSVVQPTGILKKRSSGLKEPLSKTSKVNETEEADALCSRESCAAIPTKQKYDNETKYGRPPTPESRESIMSAPPTSTRTDLGRVSSKSVILELEVPNKATSIAAVASKKGSQVMSKVVSTVSSPTTSPLASPTSVKEGKQISGTSSSSLPTKRRLPTATSDSAADHRRTSSTSDHEGLSKKELLTGEHTTKTKGQVPVLSERLRAHPPKSAPTSKEKGLSDRSTTDKVADGLTKNHRISISQDQFLMKQQKEQEVQTTEKSSTSVADSRKSSKKSTSRMAVAKVVTSPMKEETTKQHTRRSSLSLVDEPFVRIQSKQSSATVHEESPNQKTVGRKISPTKSPTKIGSRPSATTKRISIKDKHKINIGDQMNKNEIRLPIEVDEKKKTNTKPFAFVVDEHTLKEKLKLLANEDDSEDIERRKLKFVLKEQQREVDVDLPIGEEALIEEADQIMVAPFVEDDDTEFLNIQPSPTSSALRATDHLEAFIAISEDKIQSGARSLSPSAYRQSLLTPGYELEDEKLPIAMGDAHYASSDNSSGGKSLVESTETDRQSFFSFDSECPEDLISFGKVSMVYGDCRKKRSELSTLEVMESVEAERESLLLYDLECQEERISLGKITVGEFYKETSEISLIDSLNNDGILSSVYDEPDYVTDQFQFEKLEIVEEQSINDTSSSIESSDTWKSVKENYAPIDDLFDEENLSTNMSTVERGISSRTSPRSEVPLTSQSSTKSRKDVENMPAHIGNDILSMYEAHEGNVFDNSKDQQLSAKGLFLYAKNLQAEAQELVFDKYHDSSESAKSLPATRTNLFTESKLSNTLMPCDVLTDNVDKISIKSSLATREYSSLKDETLESKEIRSLQASNEEDISTNGKPLAKKSAKSPNMHERSSPHSPLSQPIKTSSSSMRLFPTNNFQEKESSSPKREFSPAPMQTKLSKSSIRPISPTVTMQENISPRIATQKVFPPNGEVSFSKRAISPPTFSQEEESPLGVKSTSPLLLSENRPTMSPASVTRIKDLSSARSTSPTLATRNEFLLSQAKDSSMSFPQSRRLITLPPPRLVSPTISRKYEANKAIMITKDTGTSPSPTMISEFHPQFDDHKLPLSLQLKSGEESLTSLQLEESIVYDPAATSSYINSVAKLEAQLDSPVWSLHSQIQSDRLSPKLLSPSLLTEGSLTSPLSTMPDIKDDALVRTQILELSSADVNPSDTSAEESLQEVTPLLLSAIARDTISSPLIRRIRLPEVKTEELRLQSDVNPLVSAGMTTDKMSRYTCPSNDIEEELLDVSSLTSENFTSSITSTVLTEMEPIKPAERSVIFDSRQSIVSNESCTTYTDLNAIVGNTLHAMATGALPRFFSEQQKTDTESRKHLEPPLGKLEINSVAVSTSTSEMVSLTDSSSQNKSEFFVISDKRVSPIPVGVFQKISPISMAETNENLFPSKYEQEPKEKLLKDKQLSQDNPLILSNKIPIRDPQMICMATGRSWCPPVGFDDPVTASYLKMAEDEKLGMKESSIISVSEDQSKSSHLANSTSSDASTKAEAEFHQESRLNTGRTAYSETETKLNQIIGTRPSDSVDRTVHSEAVILSDGNISSTSSSVVGQPQLSPCNFQTIQSELISKETLIIEQKFSTDGKSRKSPLAPDSEVLMSIMMPSASRIKAKIQDKDNQDNAYMDSSLNIQQPIAFHGKEKHIEETYSLLSNMVPTIWQRNFSGTSCQSQASSRIQSEVNTPTPVKSAIPTIAASSAGVQDDSRTTSNASNSIDTSSGVSYVTSIVTKSTVQSELFAHKKGSGQLAETQSTSRSITSESSEKQSSVMQPDQSFKDTSVTSTIWNVMESQLESLYTSERVWSPTNTKEVTIQSQLSSEGEITSSAYSSVLEKNEVMQSSLISKPSDPSIRSLIQSLQKLTLSSSNPIAEEVVDSIPVSLEKERPSIETSETRSDLLTANTSEEKSQVHSEMSSICDNLSDAHKSSSQDNLTQGESTLYNLNEATPLTSDQSSDFLSVSLSLSDFKYTDDATDTKISVGTLRSVGKSSAEDFGKGPLLFSLSKSESSGGYTISGGNESADSSLDRENTAEGETNHPEIALAEVNAVGTTLTSRNIKRVDLYETQQISSDSTSTSTGVTESSMPSDNISVEAITHSEETAAHSPTSSTSFNKEKEMRPLIQPFNTNTQTMESLIGIIGEPDSKGFVSESRHSGDSDGSKKDVLNLSTSELSENNKELEQMSASHTPIQSDVGVDPLVQAVSLKVSESTTCESSLFFHESPETTSTQTSTTFVGKQTENACTITSPTASKASVSELPSTNAAEEIILHRPLISPRAASAVNEDGVQAVDFKTYSLSASVLRDISYGIKDNRGTSSITENVNLDDENVGSNTITVVNLEQSAVSFESNTTSLKTTRLSEEIPFARQSRTSSLGTPEVANNRISLSSKPLNIMRLPSPSTARPSEEGAQKMISISENTAFEVPSLSTARPSEEIKLPTSPNSQLTMNKEIELLETKLFHDTVLSKLLNISQGLAQESSIDDSSEEIRKQVNFTETATIERILQLPSPPTVEPYEDSTYGKVSRSPSPLLTKFSKKGLDSQKEESSVVSSNIESGLSLGSQLEVTTQATATVGVLRHLPQVSSVTGDSKQEIIGIRVSSLSASRMSDSRQSYSYVEKIPEESNLNTLTKNITSTVPKLVDYEESSNQVEITDASTTEILDSKVTSAVSTSQLSTNALQNEICLTTPGLSAESLTNDTYNSKMDEFTSVEKTTSKHVEWIVDNPVSRTSSPLSVDQSENLNFELMPELILGNKISSLRQDVSTSTGNLCQTPSEMVVDGEREISDEHFNSTEIPTTSPTSVIQSENLNFQLVPEFVLSNQIPSERQDISTSTGSLCQPLSEVVVDGEQEALDENYSDSGISTAAITELLDLGSIESQAQKSKQSLTTTTYEKLQQSLLNYSKQNDVLKIFSTALSTGKLTPDLREVLSEMSKQATTEKLFENPLGSAESLIEEYSAGYSSDTPEIALDEQQQEVLSKLSVALTEGKLSSELQSNLSGFCAGNKSASEQEALHALSGIVTPLSQMSASSTTYSSTTDTKLQDLIHFDRTFSTGSVEFNAVEAKSEEQIKLPEEIESQVFKTSEFQFVGRSIRLESPVNNQVQTPEQSQYSTDGTVIDEFFRETISNLSTSITSASIQQIPLDSQNSPPMQQAAARKEDLVNKQTIKQSSLSLGEEPLRTKMAPTSWSLGEIVFSQKQQSKDKNESSSLKEDASTSDVTSHEVVSYNDDEISTSIDDRPASIMTLGKQSDEKISEAESKIGDTKRNFHVIESDTSGVVISDTSPELSHLSSEAVTLSAAIDSVVVPLQKSSSSQKSKIEVDSVIESEISGTILNAPFQSKLSKKESNDSATNLTSGDVTSWSLVVAAAIDSLTSSNSSWSCGFGNVDTSKTKQQKEIVNSSTHSLESDTVQQSINSFAPFYVNMSEAEKPASYSVPFMQHFIGESISVVPSSQADLLMTGQQFSNERYSNSNNTTTQFLVGMPSVQSDVHENRQNEAQNQNQLGTTGHFLSESKMAHMPHLGVSAPYQRPTVQTPPATSPQSTPVVTQLDCKTLQSTPAVTKLRADATPFVQSNKANPVFTTQFQTALDQFNNSNLPPPTYMQLPGGPKMASVPGSIQYQQMFENNVIVDGRLETLQYPYDQHYLTDQLSLDGLKENYEQWQFQTDEGRKFTVNDSNEMIPEPVADVPKLDACSHWSSGEVQLPVPFDIGRSQERHSLLGSVSHVNSIRSISSGEAVSESTSESVDRSHPVEHFFSLVDVTLTPSFIPSRHSSRLISLEQPIATNESTRPPTPGPYATHNESLDSQLDATEIPPPRNEHLFPPMKEAGGLAISSALTLGKEFSGLGVSSLLKDQRMMQQHDEQLSSSKLSVVFSSSNEQDKMSSLPWSGVSLHPEDYSHESKLSYPSSEQAYNHEIKEWQEINRLSAEDFYPSQNMVSSDSLQPISCWNDSVSRLSAEDFFQQGMLRQNLNDIAIIGQGLESPRGEHRVSAEDFFQTSNRKATYSQWQRQEALHNNRRYQQMSNRYPSVNEQWTNQYPQSISNSYIPVNDQYQNEYYEKDQLQNGYPVEFYPKSDSSVVGDLSSYMHSLALTSQSAAQFCSNYFIQPDGAQYYATGQHFLHNKPEPISISSPQVTLSRKERSEYSSSDKPKRYNRALPITDPKDQHKAISTSQSSSESFSSNIIQTHSSTSDLAKQSDKSEEKLSMSTQDVINCLTGDSYDSDEIITLRSQGENILESKSSLANKQPLSVIPEETRKSAEEFYRAKSMKEFKPEAVAEVVLLSPQQSELFVPIAGKIAIEEVETVTSDESYTQLPAIEIEETEVQTHHVLVVNLPPELIADPELFEERRFQIEERLSRLMEVELATLLTPLRPDSLMVVAESSVVELLNRYRELNSQQSLLTINKSPGMTPRSSFTNMPIDPSFDEEGIITVVAAANLQHSAAYRLEKFLESLSLPVTDNFLNVRNTIEGELPAVNSGFELVEGTVEGSNIEELPAEMLISKTLADEGCQTGDLSNNAAIEIADETSEEYLEDILEEYADNEEEYAGQEEMKESELDFAIDDSLRKDEMEDVMDTEDQDLEDVYEESKENLIEEDEDKTLSQITLYKGRISASLIEPEDQVSSDDLKKSKESERPPSKEPEEKKKPLQEQVAVSQPDLTPFERWKSNQNSHVTGFCLVEQPALLSRERIPKRKGLSANDLKQDNNKNLMNILDWPNESPIPKPRKSPRDLEKLKTPKPSPRKLKTEEAIQSEELARSKTPTLVLRLPKPSPTPVLPPLPPSPSTKSSSSIESPTASSTTCLPKLSSRTQLNEVSFALTNLGNEYLRHGINRTPSPTELSSRTQLNEASFALTNLGNEFLRHGINRTPSPTPRRRDILKQSRSPSPLLCQGGLSSEIEKNRNPVNKSRSTTQEMDKCCGKERWTPTPTSRHSPCNASENESICISKVTFAVTKSATSLQTVNKGDNHCILELNSTKLARPQESSPFLINHFDSPPSSPPPVSDQRHSKLDLILKPVETIKSIKLTKDHLLNPKFLLELLTPPSIIHQTPDCDGPTKRRTLPPPMPLSWLLPQFIPHRQLTIPPMTHSTTSKNERDERLAPRLMLPSLPQLVKDDCYPQSPTPFPEGAVQTAPLAAFETNRFENISPIPSTSDSTSSQTPPSTSRSGFESSCCHNSQRIQWFPIDKSHMQRDYHQYPFASTSRPASSSRHPVRYSATPRRFPPLDLASYLPQRHSRRNEITSTPLHGVQKLYTLVIEDESGAESDSEDSDQSLDEQVINRSVHHHIMDHQLIISEPGLSDDEDADAIANALLPEDDYPNYSTYRRYHRVSPDVPPAYRHQISPLQFQTSAACSRSYFDAEIETSTDQYHLDNAQNDDSDERLSEVQEEEVVES